MSEGILLTDRGIRLLKLHVVGLFDLGAVGRGACKIFFWVGANLRGAGTTLKLGGGQTSPGIQGNP